MNVQPIVGIERDTSEIVPISKVTQTGLKCNCVCYNCSGRLEAVLNTVRRKHFRHSNKGNCNPMPETELHLLAKQIILDNNRIHVPYLGMLDYCDPVAEVGYNDLIPDATITIDGHPFYIEVVVTNPIDVLKFAKYKADHAKVMVIDLEEEDRDLEYEALADIVLKKSSNKYMLDYDEHPRIVPDSEDGSGLGWILAGIAAVLLLLNLGKKKPVKRYQSKRR